MPVPRRSTLLAAFLGLGLTVATPTALAGPAQTPPGGPRSPTLPRDDEPVLLRGVLLPRMIGIPVDEIAVFRYDDVTSGFVPLPFQIDERVDHVFNPETPGEFVETIYDVFGEDDGLLDADDELVFLFGDNGTQAPVDTPWPAGADPQSYEISISDTRPGAPEPTQWAYVFTGPGLPRSPVEYVSWTVSPSTSIVAEEFALDFADRWLLTGYRVLAPCGSGQDLIDRFKGRAMPLPTQEEDEENWNLNSFFLGGISGPLRAVRYVRGATSGVNTVHHDIVYRKHWFRQVNLRVHPVESIRFYLDWLPDVPEPVLFTPSQPSGLLIDGVPDTPGPAPVAWNLLRGAGGGLALLFEVPPSPLYAQKSFFYRDDAAYDDAIATNPGYSDDDNSAYGNHGVELTTIGESNLEAIPMSFIAWPLCADAGDADLGNAYQELLTFPLGLSTTTHWQTAGPVRSLRLERQGDDVVLDWDSVRGAASYRVYAADFPDLPQSSWTPLGDTPNTAFLDLGAALAPDRYYSVVPLNPEGEGEW